MERRLNCVILNYNDAETTAGLVRLIHDYDALEKIIVVDNASSDSSVETLKRLRDKKVQLIRREKNDGYGAGNNAGVRFAAEENGASNVLIANPDVVFSEDCLYKMMRLFENHPDLAAVSAVMRDASGQIQRNGWPLRGLVGELISMGPVSRRLFRKWIEYPVSRFKGEKAAYVDVIHGSMLMVDAAKFLDAGGYDEGIFLYQEEAVLGWRLRASGYRTALLQNCSYDHKHSATISKSFKSRLARQRLREESALYYMNHYLFINRVQEVIAKLWFAGIRLEIKIAGLFGILHDN